MAKLFHRTTTYTNKRGAQRLAAMLNRMDTRTKGGTLLYFVHTLARREHVIMAHERASRIAAWRRTFPVMLDILIDDSGGAERNSVT